MQGLTRSLALQDNFQPFKQRCEQLRKLYKTFLTEYNDLEPTLLKCDERMLRGKQFEDYCSDDLQNALRKFREEVDGFSAEGSTDEQQFAGLIGELKTHVTTLNTEFNNIDAKVELFNDVGCVAKGISKCSSFRRMRKARKRESLSRSSRLSQNSTLLLH